MKKVHYGWMILILCFIALLSVQGVRLSVGAFLQPWENEFETTRGATSLIATLSLVVFGLSQPILGRLVDRYGVRIILSYSALLVGVSTLLTFFVTSFWQIIVLYGLVSAIGFGGASNVAASVAVTQWFQKRRGLAMGMITAGMSAGQLVVVPLCLFLIEWFNWQLAVLVMGSFLILIVFPLLIMFLRTSPTELGEAPYGGRSGKEASRGIDIKDETKEKESAEGERQPKLLFILKSRLFWLLATPFFICGYTTTGLIDTHLIPMSHHHGFTTEVTGLAVSLLAAFNMIGTLSSGQIADHFSNRKFLAILYFLRGLTILLLLVTDQWLLLFIFAIMFGLVDFATVAPTTMLASVFFKNHSVGFVFGLLSLGHQVGSALGAYIPGLFFDLTGGYAVSLVSAIVLLMLAAGLNLLLPETNAMDIHQGPQAEQA
ncbi:MFS transporter [Caldalkalibacillus salinus]|uniref:MFS transporter n=1 Tax=Caldalkalibacillus salinus TaxID=2803787 RepID=UPI003015B1E8